MPDNTSVPSHNTLYQLVCSWDPSKLSQITNNYSTISSNPQTTFTTYDSYKKYFEPLLFAEISSDLVSTIDKYERSNTLRNPKVRARREESGSTIARVAVKNVVRSHNNGFGWNVDIDSNDKKGPVGCIENDVIVIWKADSPDLTNSVPRQQQQQQKSTPRKLPQNAVLAVVSRVINRTGCRIVTSSFPDGNENGLALDLEEGEENEQPLPTIRVWNVLKIGSLTTMKREYEALQRIKTSQLLSKLLRPNLKEDMNTDKAGEKTPTKEPQFRNEQMFTNIIANRMGLNHSQIRAIIHSSTCKSGFAVIQGPPGTGKTRTLIAMLNVIHMTQYHEYYEGLLASIAPLSGSAEPDHKEIHEEQHPQQGTNDGSLLETMMTAMNSTISVTKSKSTPQTPKRPRRPRLLICAPSNSAVDEILTRLTKTKFYDGQGKSYCPELARVGAGDRVSDSAKPFTAEGQAEAFLDRLCSEEMDRETQKKAQLSFLGSWQHKCNGYLTQLARIPKRKQSSQSSLIELHEKLERMDRDLRRLLIAASDGENKLSREEKLRQIARTYVEDAQLVFATLSGSASSILTKKGMGDVRDRGALFDTVVIDEGAQATETSCLIPITLGASRCLLVGDPQQLPATVLSSGAAGLAYGQSLLERVCRAGQAIHLLDTQYRMHPAISSFPRRYFYKDRLVDDESVQGENRARPFHRDAVRPKFGPYVFLDITEGEEKRSRDERSIFNSSEAELAAMIYTKLKKQYPKDAIFSPAAKIRGSVSGFGVVTPYKRQMQELRQSFDRAGVPTGDVEIDTVDAFQGREKEIIVFSCVRTAAVNRGIGFVRDVRRMNVGLTRARATLIILGSAQALAEGSADWAELVDDAKSRGCLINVSNVSRCLEPQVPEKKEIEKETEKPKLNEEEKHVQHESPSRPQAGSLQPVIVQKPSRPAHPSDPRRRAHKAVVVQNPPKPQSVQNLAILQEKLRQNGFQQKGATSKQISIQGSNDTTNTANIANRNAPNTLTIPVSKAPNNPNQELQDTIRQVTKLLSEAGFRNTEALETTLKDHMLNGGALDLETVMAAAIATNNNDSKGIEKGLKEILGSKSDSTNAPASALPSKLEMQTGTSSNPSIPVTSHPHAVQNTNNTVSPSGWDLLFSEQKSGGMGGNNEAQSSFGDRKNQSEAITPSFPAANGNENFSSMQAVPQPDNYNDGKPQIGFPPKSDIQNNNYPQQEQGVFPVSGSQPNGSHGENWTAPPQNPQGGDQQFSGIQQMETVPQENDEFPNKRLRTQTPEHDQNHGQVESNANTQWNQQQQFDPNLNFSMMPNMMTSQMATAQGMDPMQYMQQQALQQQMMQQQMMQQQALQQQALQQQALQQQMMQQQAMQQQTFPQDAMLQQAAYMQMSAGGFPANGMPAGFFPMNTFQNQQAGSGDDYNPSRGSWGRGKVRGGRRNRGRFRGGRDKRRG